jgi:hypothetical protein
MPGIDPMLFRAGQEYFTLSDFEVFEVAASQSGF